MVALNTDFAASKPDTDTKNRVGRFFSLAAENVREDRRSSRKYAGEKRSYRYDTTSVDTEFEYGPFGELIRATGEKKDVFNFRFSTKYEDAETGLLYYGYRYYNAETGRWLSRDPIGELGGLNLYGFVGNDGINFFDPFGLTRTYVNLDSGYRLAVDDFNERGASSFQIHVYDKRGKEVAVINSKGNYQVRHRNNNLSKPSQIPTEVRRDIRKTVQSERYFSRFSRGIC